jgi:hypothetical protein
MDAMGAFFVTRKYAYGTTPDALTLDRHSTLLEHRLYDYLDMRAGPRGFWDDSMVQIAKALAASRRHLGDALKRLVARGLIVCERRGHWRTRYVVTERVNGAQLPLDEHPPEERFLRPTGAPPAPNGRSKGAAYLSSDKEVFTQRSDPSAGADPTHPEQWGLATGKPGRGRLDGLHTRYRGRLITFGLGHPATAEEWRRADAMCLEWARLDPRLERESERRSREAG